MVDDKWIYCGYGTAARPELTLRLASVHTGPPMDAYRYTIRDSDTNHFSSSCCARRPRLVHRPTRCLWNVMVELTLRRVVEKF